MKKIGIITLYHKNRNYGGLLQAYALQKVISNFADCEATQIAYSKKNGVNVLSRWENKSQNRIQKLKRGKLLFILLGIKSKYFRFKDKYFYKIKKQEIEKKLEQRIQAMDAFEEVIPHTEVVYENDIADKLNSKFDVFITGSDQVWNPDYIQSAYVLDFTDKKKISYAASVGKKYLYENEKKFFEEKLASFDSISVRENTSILLFNNLISEDKKIDVVLDPTLLLSREEWDKVIEPYHIDGPYILTYFLGTSSSQRKAATKLANERKCKIVSFPHINGSYRNVDSDYGDYQIYNASPLQFVYLIKNANLVVTDSFHATVFSIIYKVDFVVFDRVEYSKSLDMNDRINHLLDLFNISYKICDKRVGRRICVAESIDETKYKSEKEKSINFLINSISK